MQDLDLAGTGMFEGRDWRSGFLIKGGTPSSWHRAASPLRTEEITAESILAYRYLYNTEGMGLSRIVPPD